MNHGRGLWRSSHTRATSPVRVFTCKRTLLRGLHGGGWGGGRVGCMKYGGEVQFEVKTSFTRIRESECVPSLSGRFPQETIHISSLYLPPWRKHLRTTGAFSTNSVNTPTFHPFKKSKMLKALAVPSCFQANKTIAVV